MRTSILLPTLSSLLWIQSSYGQTEPTLLPTDEHFVLGDVGEDPDPQMNAYDAMNKALGGDSVRSCAGHPCLGWVEDHHPDGSLKHRGFYDAGQLTHYKNYWPDGTMEREFRSVDAVRSILRTYHSNGQLRSEARYVKGTSVQYEDHYLDGKLRYAEERHRTEPYFLRMDLYAADGNPISTLQLVDKKKVEFLHKEFHPGGALRSEGRARYDPSRMDTQRTGTWTYYDKAGTVVKHEDYQDGRVASVH
jgi:antitoxin component YwqK of YwqJK toxin-antitoxin module